MSLVFLWRTKTGGPSFRRAVECLAPVLLEARIDASPSGLSLVGIADGLSAELWVPFEGTADGDYVQFGSGKVRAVFCLDLKETANWLTQYRPEMTLELLLDSDNGLTLKMFNEGKSFEHSSTLSNLRVPTDMVASDGNAIRCDQLADVSSTALCAVARHHHKTNSHARFYVTEGRLAVESCLLEVSEQRKSCTYLTGVVQHLQCDRPAILSELPGSAGDGLFYPLDTVKKILKASSFQERKKGRVMLGLNKDGPLVLVFSRGPSYLKFAIVSSSAAAEKEDSALEPLKLERTESVCLKKVIKRKQTSSSERVKKQKVAAVPEAAKGA